MYNTNVTNARANLYNLINMAIDNNEVININTKTEMQYSLAKKIIIL